jgi:hypothetical protein
MPNAALVDRMVCLSSPLEGSRRDVAPALVTPRGRYAGWRGRDAGDADVAETLRVSGISTDGAGITVKQDEALCLFFCMQWLPR